MQFLSSSVAQSFRHLLSAGSCAAVLAAVWSAGCNDSEPPMCCLAEPTCPEGAQEVDTCDSGACFTVSACCETKLCQPEPECVLSCPPGEAQVESCDDSAVPQSCHPVQGCDRVIHCEAPPFCTATPSCDEGDDELASDTCPGGEVACYPVELCGFTILCADNGLPHGCPETTPVEGNPCPDAVTCEYPVEGSDCVETWACMEPRQARAPIPDEALNHWHLLESTCEGGAGGASGAGGAGGAGGSG